MGHTIGRSVGEGKGKGVEDCFLRSQLYEYMSLLYVFLV